MVRRERLYAYACAYGRRKDTRSTSAVQATDPPCSLHMDAPALQVHIHNVIHNAARSLHPFKEYPCGRCSRRPILPRFQQLVNTNLHPLNVLESACYSHTDPFLHTHPWKAANHIAGPSQPTRALHRYEQLFHNKARCESDHPPCAALPVGEPPPARL